MQSRIGQALETRISRPEVTTEGIAGQTLEEVKLPSGPALTSDIAPLANPQFSRLIGGVPYSDELRLSSPKTVGSMPDYVSVRGAQSKAQGARSSQLRQLLERAPSGISEQSLSHMRASLAREQRMWGLLGPLTDTMGQILHRVLGAQEG